MKVTMAKDEKTKKPKESKDEGIVMKETKDDILTAEMSGDPEDFKKEVNKEAQKGRAMRIVLPILFFVLLGALVAAGTWYVKNRSEEAEPKEVTEKIQTPPVVEEPVEEVVEEPVAEEVPAEEAPVEKEPATSGDTITYTVESGDTLSGIANQYDMTSTELAEYNNISDPESLQIGQKIKIPQS